LWEHPWPGSEPKVTQPLVVGGNRLVVASGYGVGAALLEISANDSGQLAAREIWANRNFKPKFTNVVLYEEFLYGLDEGILVCLDLNTGERRWKKGRYNHGQVLRVEDLLLVLAEDGAAVLVEATPDSHRELARFQVLEGKTWGHPVVAPPYLLVRNDHEAACYELTFE
jgi:outer membrane protein assembly factor BamB